MKLCELCGAKNKRCTQRPYIHHQIIKTEIKMENKSIWGKILNIVITVLTAIATTFGVTSCIGM